MQRQNKILKDYRRMRRLLESGVFFTSFDTETTGIDFRKCHVIEVGAVCFNKIGVIKTYNSLVKIDEPLSQVIKNITGITDKMLSSAPSIITVLNEFLEFSKDTILLGHNVTFDLNFINEELSRLKMCALKNKAIDTLNMSRWAYPFLKTHKLQELAKNLKIDVVNAHRAQDDARVTMELFLRMIKDTESVQKI